MSNSDIFISTPLVDQFKETKDLKWKRYTCGICAIKMLMSPEKPGVLKIPVTRLIKETVAMGGYAEKIGWGHRVLTELALKYGVKVDFQKKFPKTRTEKNRKLTFINKNIKNGKPVIVSVLRDFIPGNDGHLVVVNGLRLNTKGTVGYHIQDPDPRGQGNNYFITKKEFLRGWRGGMLWLG